MIGLVINVALMAAISNFDIAINTEQAIKICREVFRQVKRSDFMATPMWPILLLVAQNLSVAGEVL